MYHLILLLLSSAAFLAEGIYLSNLNSTCFRCICEASTGCSNRLQCEHGYCGPFSISRAYWIDAGKVVKEQDDSNRWGAYEDCANEYDCATNIITQYMEKYGKDCNNDGRVDCVDYAMLHINGGPTCHMSLHLEFSRKFDKCLHGNNRQAVPEATPKTPVSYVNRVSTAHFYSPGKF
ncbi:lysozyme 2-like [Toxorhynchites rutilus septentrionalis]|uniref:lysozyme 2-like n=1 Tax=Toxorhynchites rutilus septentrionalis TaxID=329112 RepID=UPI00247A945B|nr:lysozyme 2-like [Toxorhynchites rutilus septentrionalis]